MSDQRLLGRLSGKAHSRQQEDFASVIQAKRSSTNSLGSCISLDAGLTMADNVTPRVRSRTMAQIKSKGMKPEMKVRRLLHGLGYRYRLHRTDLPGRPDLVFSARRKVVFVNGCFWHCHSGCSMVRIPATNRNYWVEKLERNRTRDSRNIELLEEKGWAVTTVWECQLQDMASTAERLVAFLDS